MARKLRVQFPGAIYHVLSRGNRREDIFRDDLDRESFLQTLADACAKTGWQVHAFCLMRNHFHLVVETPEANLVAGMKWFLGTYTARFNRRHKLSGHVFAGRYKSLLVGGEGGYLRTVCDYVHLNPVRAKLLAAEAALRSFRWSSFPMLVAGVERPAWLRVDRVFGESGIPQDSAAGRREFERRLEARRASEGTESVEELASIRRGWCFGDDEFRKELLTQMEGKFGVSHYGVERQEASEEKANRIVAEELGVARWTEIQLQELRKGDPEKLRIARRLRAETTVTLQWIAARLNMGTKTHLSHLLYWGRRAKKGTGKVQRPQLKQERAPREVPPTSRAEVISTSARTVLGATPKEALPILLTDPNAEGFDTSFD
jgi:REP element-mobilizing transposase RayT